MPKTFCRRFFCEWPAGRNRLPRLTIRTVYFARAAINASLDLLRGRKRSKAVAIDDVENRAGGDELVSTATS